MAENDTQSGDGDVDSQEQPDASETTESSFDEKKARERLSKANAEAANLRKRLKDLEPLAARAKELEDAGKTEIERLTEQLAQAQRSANEAEARALRFEVAAEHKLTPAQAKWLQGKDRDELEANVAELLEAFGAAKPPEPEKKDDEPEPGPDRDPNPRRRPQERLRAGAVPDVDTEPVETDPRKLAAMVPRPLLGMS